MLPVVYQDLTHEPGPKMLTTALALYGTHEAAGAADNPVLLDWARELGVQGYNHDAVPWCGLFMAKVAHDAGKSLAVFARPSLVLWALAWAHFGESSQLPSLGDVLIFRRDGGGHVGLYVGEDATAYHVLGGNTGDAVAIARISRLRLHAARRPPYTVTPANVRPIHRASTGALSANEA